MVLISLHDPKSGWLSRVQFAVPGPDFTLQHWFEVEILIPKAYLEEWDFGRLHGKTAEQATSILKLGVQSRGKQYSPNFFDPTQGNVGHTMDLLMKWGEQNRAATWQIRYYKAKQGKSE